MHRYEQAVERGDGVSFYYHIRHFKMKSYITFISYSSATPAAFAAMWTCLVLIVLSIKGTIIMRKVSGKGTF
jgi:hypothetical protein